MRYKIKKRQKELKGRGRETDAYTAGNGDSVLSGVVIGRGERCEAGQAHAVHQGADVGEGHHYSIQAP